MQAGLVGPRRTIGSIMMDNRRFMEEGGGDPDKAKEYYNAIDKPLFRVDLNRVRNLNKH